MVSTTSAYQMEKIYVKCSEPHSLIMRMRVCDYCRANQYEGGEQVPSNDGSVYIMLNFGVLSCKKHSDWARRDCNAYLARNGRIRMADAEAIPAVGNFIRALRSRERGFPVLRSNGDIDYGWELDERSYQRPNTIYKISGDWMIRVKTIDDARDIMKGVSIADYLRGGLSCHFPEGFVNDVRDTLTALDAGFYNEDTREWEKLSQEPDNGYIPDPPQIKEAIGPSGLVYRVLNHEEDT
jgi:hypothetical protein